MNPVQLALRVLRTDRRSRASALLTALGVAVATALITFLATLPNATEVRGEREQWLTDLTTSEAGGQDGTRAVRTTDFVGDDEITRVDTAGPVTSDGPRMPGPGEVLLSPELSKLVEEMPDGQLADRFQGRTVGTIDQQHLRFPEQLMAVVGHPAGALDNAEEGSVGDIHAGDDFMLSLLAGVGIVLLAVPSLVLVASTSRLTAARRERRLAAVRLAGGTPGQVIASVAAEIGIASIGGTVLGIVLGWPLRHVFRNVPWGGGTWLVSDFSPSPLVMVGVGLGIPVLVVLASVLGLRRVVRAPLGAAMQHSRTRPRAWRLLAIGATIGLFMFGLSQMRETGGPLIMLLALVAVVLTASIVGPWVTATIGSIFTRLWRRAPTLLAGRRLVSDPKSAYRAASGVVLAVFVGSLTLTLLPGFESMAGSGTTYKDSVLYARVPSEKAGEIEQRASEQIERGDTDATVSMASEVILRGPQEELQSGLVMSCERARETTRFQIDSCDGPPAVYTSEGSALPADGLKVENNNQRTGEPELLSLPPGVPIRPLGIADGDVSENVLIEPELVPGLNVPESVVTAAPATDADRDGARTALTVAAPGVDVESRELTLGSQERELDDLRRVAVIGVSISALLAGCSAAIAAAASVYDRRRTFGALIAAGTPIRVLTRALRTEAALPAIVATTGAGIAGVAVGFGLLTLFDADQLITPWVFGPIVLGVLVGLIAASACGPMLRGVSAEPLADE